MTESIEHPSQCDGPVPPGQDALAVRIERLRALRSAFTALAPSALHDAGRALSQVGRDLTQRLTDARREQAPLAADALARLDADLDAFEGSMRSLARDLPIPQMRSMLPGRLGRDRASVLDLLDLLLGGCLDEDGRLADRIGAVDYLITLLCTYGARRAGTVAHDPVGLTPRLAALGARADAICDARVDEAESEFYAAAGMDRESLREEFQRRTLRQRKVELGLLFFSARILRAIVTYNAALLERVTDEILDAGDWGRIEGDASGSGADGAQSPSVFESPHLRLLADAMRRRVRGEATDDSPQARIVAALDLEALEPSEREALAGEAVGSADDPIGTAILVGLLCRSLAVLSVDLQRFGIAPDDVSDLWLGELDRSFENRIDLMREKDAYKQACALAELRNKLLLEPLAERLREERGAPPGGVSTATKPAPETASSGPTTSAAIEKGPQPGSPRTAATPRADRGGAGPKSAKTPTHPRPARARDLVREALEDDRRGRRAKPEEGTPTGWSPARLVQVALLVLALAAAGYVHLAGGGRELHAFSREQLGTVSPHLVEGHRNGHGHGPGFVGTLDESWEALAPEERRSAADALVSRLREHGLEQVMVYDRNHALRIQAIGSQPIRAL